MALKVKDLQKSRKECVVNLEDGSSVKVAYNPNKISAVNLNAAGEGLNSLCESLSHILIAWDIYDEDDAIMPVTIDNLKSLNLMIVNKIFEAVLTDSFPKAR
jgi:hypothetical protein